MNKAIFFDLDNTLYDYKQYFIGAFKKIANYLFKKYNVPEEKSYQGLIKLWEKKTSNYSSLFNDLLKLLDIENDKLVKKIVKIFNQYKGNLKPYPDVIPNLKFFRKQGYKLGIITDGNIKRQKRKIKSLGIKDFFKVIIYARGIEPKPSEKPFLAGLKKMRIKPENAFYLADNPLIDFQGAKKAGMKTIRILRGEFENYPANQYIDFEIKNFDEVLKIIERQDASSYPVSQIKWKLKGKSF